MTRLIAGVLVCASSALAVVAQASTGPNQVVAPGQTFVVLESATLLPIAPVSITSPGVTVNGSLATDRACRKGRRIEFRWDRTGAVVKTAKTSSKGKFSSFLPM